MKEKLKRCSLLRKAYNVLKRVHNKLFMSPSIVTRKVFSYQKKRFFKYSGAFKESKVKDMAYLTWLYHVIEKGLAMPEMRLGFGHDKILELVRTIFEDQAKYGNTAEVIDAVSAIKEYERVHLNANFTLPNEINNAISKIKLAFKEVEPLHQKIYTKQDYFKDTDKDFKTFSLSRHSVRNFSGHVPIENVIKAIDLAHYCPSACNRQPVRVHVVDNKELLIKCLSLQNGNRGFGNLADKLLILTGDLSTVLGGQEFFDLGNNVGIFTMNLCYSLHYYHIAQCVLNWYAMPKEDKELRKLLNIPDEETVFSFIVCGDAPKQFKVVKSPRVPTTQIYTIHS